MSSSETGKIQGKVIHWELLNTQKTNPAQEVSRLKMDSEIATGDGEIHTHSTLAFTHSRSWRWDTELDRDSVWRNTGPILWVISLLNELMFYNGSLWYGDKHVIVAFTAYHWPESVGDSGSGKVFFLVPASWYRITTFVKNTSLLWLGAWELDTSFSVLGWINKECECLHISKYHSTGGKEKKCI